MTREQLFREIYIRLKNSKIELPHMEAGWIIERYSGVDFLERINRPEVELTSEIADKINEAVTRRSQGEPLAYIFGEKDFFGYTFTVNPKVLIPRPETEILVEWALEWVKKNSTDHEIEILDLGAGSGCIGISLLKEISRAQLTALDFSKDALEVAKRNAARLEVADRANFIHLDAKKAGHLLNKFDLIVANPPYIAFEDKNVAEDVKKYEPHAALFSQDEGLSDIKSWAQALPNILKPRAAVGFEIGATQGEAALRVFRDLGIFSQHYLLKDYAERDRVVCGEK